MMEHRFVSDWGTDGSQPDERYVLAGGLGDQREMELAVPFDWQQNPVLFKSAVLSAIEQAIKKTDVTVQGMFFSVNTGPGSITYTTISPERFKMQPDRVNIGIAFDRERLYLTLQFESFYMTYSQIPSITDGILSFAAQCAPGMSPYLIYTYYRPKSSPLTAAQISYASFLNPHCVPLDVPPLTVAGFELTGLLNGPKTYTDFPFLHIPTGSEIQGNEFSSSMNIRTVAGDFRKGVYTITISGKSPTGMSYFTSQLSTYCIIVD